MTDTLCEQDTRSYLDSLRKFAGSRMAHLYFVITVLSIVVLSLYTGNVGTGAAAGGWVGLIGTIVINELTPGFTMEKE